MQTPRPSIPQPCAQPWAAMSPTADGRHCATCATEVVDFTRLSNSEILAYLASHQGQRVCALAHARQLAPPPPAAPWRRWMLAGLALLGLAPTGPANAAPPVLPPLADFGGQPPAPGRQVVVRGQVLDGRDGSPVPGARVMVKDTKYGTVTDDKGNFELLMATTFEAIKKGELRLEISGSPFAFEPQTVVVKVGRKPKPTTLAVRLKSIAGRGNIMGKIRMPEPPVAPPR